jgi:chromosome segregation ATPase
MLYGCSCVCNCSYAASLTEQNRAAVQAKRELDAAHRMEVRQIHEGFAERQRGADADRAKADELAEQLRQKSQEWENKMRSMEKQIRTEENMKRQELISKLQMLAQHRDGLQQNLNANIQTHRQAVNDYEARLTREKESHQDVHTRIAVLTHERDQLRADFQKLRDRADQWDEVEHGLKVRAEKAELENGRLKTELNKVQRALDRVREDELNRAKDLERAVTGYVRSVERSEPNLNQ